jgi:hypothetical protein
MRLVGEDAVYTLGTADDITMDDIEKNMVVVVRRGEHTTLYSSHNGDVYIYPCADHDDYYLCCVLFCFDHDFRARQKPRGGWV